MIKKYNIKVSPILVILLIMTIGLIILSLFSYSNPTYNKIMKYIPIIFAGLLLYDVIRNIRKW